MLPFQLRKLGHVVLNVTDLEASVRFYTGVLGLEVSDRYPDTMVPGGMVFMRCNADHHGVALVGGAAQTERSSLNHFAFEVATLDEVFRARAWLSKHDVPIVFEGRRRAGGPRRRSARRAWRATRARGTPRRASPPRTRSGSGCSARSARRRRPARRRGGRRCSA